MRRLIHVLLAIVISALSVHFLDCKKRPEPARPQIQEKRPTEVQTEKTSYRSQFGLREDDEIVSVNGIDVATEYDKALEVAEDAMISNKSLTIVYKRGEQISTVTEVFHTPINYRPMSTLRPFHAEETTARP